MWPENPLVRQAKIYLLLSIALFGGPGYASPEGAFSRPWTYASETSAVIYWQSGDISQSANSYVEYGKTEELGRRTDRTVEPRWSHLHRLTGLETGVEYFYRMVDIDPSTGEYTTSDLHSLRTAKEEGTIYIPGELAGPPYILDEPDTKYVLTRDITADGTAIDIVAKGVVLDLDGHTVTFGDNTPEQVYGVRISSSWEATLCNGFIVQGRRSREYSAAVGSINRPRPTEVFGISTDVHLKCAYPMFFSSATDLQVHHNHIYSRVTELENRHYPGNSLLRVYILGRNIHIHDNLFTEGCHWGMVLRERGDNVEIDHNDIRHHQQYVNGYAISASAGADVHHNRITSTGRATHMTRDGIRFHDNYIDTKGHMHLSDLPAGTRPFHHRYIALHGIKLEGRRVKNCKVYNNFVRITQRPSIDSDGQGNPLNKKENGVYIRGKATSISSDMLVDTSRSWEADRWRNYFVKYSPALPPALISRNDTSRLYGEFAKVPPGEYSIYMKWNYVPPTPLNIACYDPNAMNEVYDNKFIAITHFAETRHGEYGDSGTWASSVYFVGMNKGPADSGKYSCYVHDNEFYSNDLFMSTDYPMNMTVIFEDNSFSLVDSPLKTARENRMRNLDQPVREAIRAGNTFEE